MGRGRSASPAAGQRDSEADTTAIVPTLGNLRAIGSVHAGRPIRTKTAAVALLRSALSKMGRVKRSK